LESGSRRTDTPDFKSRKHLESSGLFNPLKGTRNKLANSTRIQVGNAFSAYRRFSGCLAKLASRDDAIDRISQFDAGASLSTFTRPADMSPIILEDPIRDAALKVWISTITAGGEVSSVKYQVGSAFRLGARLQLEDGNYTEIFLKIDLGPRESTGYDLDREHQILRRLESTRVRAPRTLGFDAELGVMAMECLGGTSDYGSIGGDARLRETVDRSLIESLAEVHRIKIETLKLPYLPSGRNTPWAMGTDLETWRALLFKHVAAPDAVTLFAFAWLSARMPVEERPAVLVHGDAGPGNFLFDRDGVTGLVDWEMTHVGHPLEDLGAVLARSLLQPMSAADKLVQLYEEASGIHFGRDELIYATVLLMARFNVPILIALEKQTTALDYRMTNNYLRLSQISMLTLIASAEEITIDEKVSTVGSAPSIRLELDYLSGLLRDVIQPRITDDYGRCRLDDAIGMIGYLKRATSGAGSFVDEKAEDRINVLAKAIAAGKFSTSELLRDLLATALHREDLMTDMLGPLKGRRIQI
jgi:tRNA A-37 threonylcarbamoyl transferase component Bud32